MNVLEAAIQDQIVSTWDWVLTLVIMGIPFIGVIMTFVWAFGGGAKQSKSNFAKASLLLVVIGFLLFCGLVIIVAVFDPTISTAV